MTASLTLFVTSTCASRLSWHGCSPSRLGRSSGITRTPTNQHDTVSLVLALAAMVAVLMLMVLLLAAVIDVLMLLALSDVSLALTVMVADKTVAVLVAIAAAVVVGERVRELTLHRTGNGDCASSSSNAANTPSATSLSVADESTLATSASGFVSQTKQNLLPSSSSSRPYTGCTILKHPTQMLFGSRIKLLPIQRSPEQHMPLSLLDESC
jgi:hypothetical protein